MTLTVEQLTELKDKIIAENIYPMQAIKQLYPNEDINAIREQLFVTYPRNELIANITPKITPNINSDTKEQQLQQIQQQINRLERRKQQLISENI